MVDFKIIAPHSPQVLNAGIELPPLVTLTLLSWMLASERLRVIKSCDDQSVPST